MLKKAFLLSLAFVMIFSLAACAGQSTTLVLSFDSSVCEASVISDAIRTRLSKQYISDNNIDIINSSSDELTVHIDGKSLTDEQIKILLYSDSLNVKDSGGNIVLSSDDFLDCGIDFDTSMSAGTGENGCFVKMTFTSDGAEKFKELTRELSGRSEEAKRKLYFYCGDKLIYEPVINSTVISEDIMLTGDFDIDEAILSSAYIFSAIKPLPCLVEVKRE